MVTLKKQASLFLPAMTRNEINMLLRSRDINFRRVAIDNIVMTFPLHSDMFFSAFHDDGELAKQMADAAQQWMPVLREGYYNTISSFKAPETYLTFRSLADSYAVFLHEMHKYLESMDSTTAQQTTDTLWYYFPGLRGELQNATTYPKPEEHRQLMVFVTGRCNLHCPYCFSKELQRLSISKTDMLRILAWAQRCNVQSLLPCGGEPLLYEHMNWLIREVAQRSMKMYFATNLSVPLPAAMLNSENDAICQLHVHLTYELFQHTTLMSTFLDNLRRCRNNGIDIILRGNICGDEVEDYYDEWFRIAKNHGINALNVAMAIPSHTGSNSFVRFESVQTLIPRLRYIWEQGRKHGIRVSIAKPLPLCLLPDDLALDILRHNNNATFCNIGEDSGMHNLSLSNDMRFSPCLGIDEPNIPFADDLEWNTLRNVFSQTVRALQSQPLFERCKSCFLYHRQLCQGSCLSYKQNSRNGGVPCTG